MGKRSEAACLLEQGAAFPRRAGIDRGAGRIALVGVKPGAMAIYLDDEPYFHLDLEGRWQRALIGGVHFLKGLDGAVDVLDRTREEGSLVLRRRSLPFAEVVDLDEQVRATAITLLSELSSGQASIIPPTGRGEPLNESELRELLDRIAAWDAAAWFRHIELHRNVYFPAKCLFLPPTCSEPIVLEATVGRQGSWLFGPSQHATAIPHRSGGEFENHVHAVSRLLGRRLAQAKGIVLASDDALRLPTDQVARWLETASRVFPWGKGQEARRPRLSDRLPEVAQLQGAFAFLGSPASVDRSAEDWRRLADLGLRWVDVGIASGSPAVRAAHGLEWNDDALIRSIGSIKQAGIGIGAVIPVGCGGTELADAHVAETARLAGSLPFAREDIVYLVDVGEIAGSEPATTRLKRSLAPLSGSMISRQLQSLKDSLMELRKNRGVKVVPYSMVKT
jgi:hypothetical protein